MAETSLAEYYDIEGISNNINYGMNSHGVPEFVILRIMYLNTLIPLNYDIF